MVFKNFAYGLAYLLGLNILLRVGILMDLGDGKAEARIILGHRGHLYREVMCWEDTS
jgi:hypothetical protein